MRQPKLLAFILLAWVLSVVGLWLLTANIVLTAAYAFALIVFAALALFIVRAQARVRSDDVSLPDWSVTVAAIEQEGVAIAITDRANRFVCANGCFVNWFGAEMAPPNLPVEREGLERLSRAGRDALREGKARAEFLKQAGGDNEWEAEAERAGRGDDYLIWRIWEYKMPDPTVQLTEMVAGPLGRLMSAAGVETALVTHDGMIRGVSAGFAERAAGDPSATLAGQEFVSHLRTDERDRIYFAREGRKGAPQILVQIPLDDEDTLGVSGGDADGEKRGSMMLMLESGLGLGSAAEGAGSGTTAQLEALLGALPLGLAMTDRDGRFLFGNEAFLRAIGRENGPMPSYPADLVVRDDKSAFSDAVRRFGKGPASSGDIAVRLAHNAEEPVSVSFAGVRGLGEAAVLISIVDTTEETKLKRQVAQATKMQAVGQLAGGVAHDFNNVLTAIIGYCDLMLLRHTPGDSDYDDIQQIRINSNRAASLTRQLLAFSRQQTLRPEIIQLPDVVSEVSQLLKRLLGENIELKLRHDRDLGHVRADPQQLEQVIVNLAVNARDAIQSNSDGRGKLSMETRRLPARNVRNMGSDIIPEADYTVLTVEDTGGGIPADKISKIFEPFFTTKEQGKGTGLGLSTVYGIVKQSGGFIFADNIEDEAGMPIGARFTVYLPVYNGPLPTPKANETAKPATEWAGGGRILLVEDEDMVRAVAERALVRAGFEVVAASDGDEGLSAITAGGVFDLVVSDVVMPGMDGPSMAREIRKTHSALPILFMSGYAEEQLRGEIEIDHMYFIAKPFSVAQITEKVSGILSASLMKA